MYKRLIYLAAFVLLLDLGAAIEGAIITNVVRSNGASETRTPIGVYTGITPPLPTQAGGLMDGNYVFSDRTYTWVNTPAQLIGAEYVCTFNSDKTTSAVTYTVTFPIGATVLLTCDDRFTTPQSYVDNIVRDFAAPGEFTDTGWDVFVNGDSNRQLSVYSAIMDPGTYVFHDQASTANNFYIIGALPRPPSYKATNPSPPSSSTVLLSDAWILTWSPGKGATSHQVYFGTDPSALELVATKASGDESYATGLLSLYTTYYWKVKESNDTNVWQGDIWSFTTTEVLSDEWLSEDIGTTGGSTTYDGINDVWTIVADGSDIWDTSDQFRYVYLPTSGDCHIIARVNSLVQTNEWAKAGVMIRESLTGNSKFVDVVMTPENGARCVSLQWRPQTGDFCRHIQKDYVLLPEWVKLVREEDTFTGYHSQDGIAWTEIGSATILMTQDVYIGLAVT